MKTAIGQTHIDVRPGGTARVEIDVTNTDEVIDGVTAIVDGINPDWIRLERPLVSLFPEATDRLAVVFDIPRHCPAGDYLVVLRVVSTIDAERETVHDFWLTVAPVPAIELTLRPTIVTAGSTGTLAAVVTNTGNCPATVTVAALDPTREVDCRVDPATFHVAQGAEAQLDIEMRGPRPWLGQPSSRQVHVTAQVDDLVVERVATFNRKPRIPRGLITAITLAAIVALWALIFLWVVTEMRRGAEPAKAPATELLTGPENIPLAAVAGTASGTVTAATTGEGVPRIVVEAFRVGRDGDLASVGSSATGDDGTYELPGLIPGTYRFQFGADGFVETWYTDADGNDDVAIGVLAQVDGLDVVIPGGTGTITGRVDLPDGATGPLTVTATLVAETSEAQPFTVTTSTDAEGNIVIPGVPTPGTFLITVSGPGFETQEFEQEVGGGQQSVINTVDLGAADGAITGLVVDDAGTPLGGVEVVARAGDRVLTALTPTAGDVGRFELVGLPTPDTYVLTFSLDDHSGQTIALELGPGATQDVTARLVGGIGTVTGAVVDAAGLGVGGVTVEVTGEGFSGTTSTLTTSGSGGEAGSFSVSDLPVPGDYTISFTSDEYQTETVGASFTTPGSVSIGQVVLAPRTAQVRGTVSVAGGGGIGEIVVRLSDGRGGQVTTSATNPAGSFAFAGVAPGSYTLTFEHPAFVTRVVLVRVTAGADVVTDTVIRAVGS